ncbi:MAG: AhpC/TSA family protein [Cytophagales bacterium]|nr:AhpC/TSA family protein [Cytophagales bacterium]
MKRSFFFLACLVAGLLGVPAAAQPGYQIKGTITDAGNSWVYLSRMDGREYRKVDSVKMQQGQFVFRGRVAEPDRYLLQLQSVEGDAELILENKVITVQGPAGKLWEAKVTGSPLTDEFLAYRRKYTNPAREEAVANTIKANQLRASGDSTGAERLLSLNGQIVQEQNLIASEYIAAHPEAFQSLMLLHWTWDRFGLETSKKMLSSLAPQWQNHALARETLAAIKEQEGYAEKAKTGTPFASFQLPDAKGQPVDLASFRGKYVFIDFWASWCGPCRAENPNLVKAYQKFNGKPFEIVGISLDEKKEPWLKAIEKDNLPWVHLSDLKGWKNDLTRHYGIKWIPSSFLLDPEGRIIARDLRGEALDKMLSQLLE